MKVFVDDIVMGISWWIFDTWVCDYAYVIQSGGKMVINGGFVD